MALFKCKMCGGTLDIENKTVVTCEYCGTQQTIPKLDDERKANLYDRANHFRRNNEYDKAMSIYEQILNEDTEDAESYWSLVLCTYGIEYVEDPVSRRRVPTVNRAQKVSVFADENYKAALKYADYEQKAVYESEAKQIEEIQKRILAISEKEEPYDVFICYKESDASGRRTQDSVLANDLYHQLTQEGFKVFFSRITLEDKLGSDYEPYIFAALQSAKVMVVLGTKPEYFNAVWVKNEWSRFLALIKNGADKVLVPAYRDMDPYDLPEAMSYLQAQDMSKLGFMQDLIRGIKKIVGAEKKAENNAGNSYDSMPARQNETTGGARPLVTRAFLFLEDGDFSQADAMCEQALNQEPTYAEAYVGKLMVQRKLRTREELSVGTEELSENNYFQKALRFADEELKNELNRCNQIIIDRKKDIFYQETLNELKQNRIANSYENAIRVLDNSIARFESLHGWRDSEAQIKECQRQKEELIAEQKNGIYQKALNLYKQACDCIETVQDNVDKKQAISNEYRKAHQCLDDAIQLFGSLGDWNDGAVQTAVCKEKKEYLTESLYQKVQNLMKAKNKKQDLVMIGKYLQELADYKDSQEMEKAVKPQIIKKRIKSALIIISLLTVLGCVFCGVKWYYDSIAEFDAEDYQRMGSPSVLRLPYGVKTIKRGTFMNCDNLVSVKIPSSVEEIEYNAFNGCSNLKSVKISGKLESIEFNTFKGCTSLESIVIPNSVTYIGAYTFDGCTSLESIVIPNSVTYIRENTFDGCSSLKSVKIPNGVRWIGYGAFYGCSSLESVEIPDSVEEIGERAFFMCDNLQTIITSEGSYASKWAKMYGYNVRYE